MCYKQTIFHLILCLFFLLIITNSCKKSGNDLPELITKELTEITDISAIGGGLITDEGSSSVHTRGLVWCIAPVPSINIYVGMTEEGSGSGSFSSEITGLEAGNTYYVRAYAINEEGVSYGQEISFSTESFPSPAPCENFPTVTDIDGNTYQTVKIGEQCWMASNLKVSVYNDGSEIPNITEASEWTSLTEDAFCWYENNKEQYGNIYGALYNSFAVQTGKLCPEGWRVPSIIDWDELIDYLGGEHVAGGILKQAGTEHWISPNEHGTDKVGFSALPAGDRNSKTGVFDNLGTGAFWWTYMDDHGSKSWATHIPNDIEFIHTGYVDKEYGLSVRCIKD